jgi:hypothetical protein
MTAAERDDRPMGGFAGERFPLAKPEPRPPAPEPLRIEPPPWAGQEGDVVLAPDVAPDPGPPLDALSALKAEEPFEPPPLDLEPPVHYEPLTPVPIPPPTWREDEERRKAAEAQDLYEPMPSAYPARRGAEEGREP